ncbi:chondroadherin [Prorops nasuta]|uniref:chondroadherin n=1 Tax=Prorops nasuta TaxID=863751 RepID=UPI0034CDBCD9
MYCKAQIRKYLLLCILVVSVTVTAERPNILIKNTTCITECICLSPKQVLCNTGGLKHIPTDQFPSTIEELSLTKNNFSIIPTDAFAGLSMLRKLSLNENNISSIRPFAFRKLHRLRELSIQYTPLASIENFSFAALQNVTVILLANNKIQYIDGSSFAGSFNIKVIILSNNPLLTIRSNAFTGLTNVEGLILPSGIRVIEQDAFKTLQNVGLLKLTFMDLSGLKPYTFRGLSYVHDLNIQDSDLGIIDGDAFTGMSNILNLNLLNNKIDFIQRLNFTYDAAIQLFRFHGNHLLEAPRQPEDIILEVSAISAIDNHFPCDCQAHNILDSDFVNGSSEEFQRHNYCLSPIKFNGKRMNLIDFDSIAKCYDNVVKDNLGSGVIALFHPPLLLIMFLSIKNVFLECH